MAALAEACETEIVSEYEPQYWGFETQEQWDEYEEKRFTTHLKEFKADVVKYVHGEPHNIGPKTIGMAIADRVKDLVAGRPELLAVGNESELEAVVDNVFSANAATAKGVLQWQR